MIGRDWVTYLVPSCKGGWKSDYLVPVFNLTMKDRFTKQVNFPNSSQRGLAAKMNVNAQYNEQHGIRANTFI